MSLHGLLYDLRQQGIRLKVSNNKLLYLAPKGSITEDIKEKIRLYKIELINILSEEAYNKQKLRPVFPTSFAQKRIIISDKLFSGDQAYNIAAGVKIQGNLNTSYLDKTLKLIVMKHSILNTNVEEKEGDFKLIARENLPELTIEKIEPSKNIDSIIHNLTEIANIKFDIYKDPLVKFRLFEISKNDYIFLFVTHHLVADGWSLSIFINELITIYKNLCRSNDIFFNKNNKQYWDYINFQNNFLLSQEYTNQLRFWKENLANVPKYLELPYDKYQKNISNKGDILHFEIDEQFSDELKKYARQQKVTLFLFLLGCFQILLAKYTRNNEVFTATSISNRHHPGFENVIGPFVNNIIFKNTINFSQSFADFLRSMQQNYIKVLENQDVPLEYILQELKLNRDAQNKPFMQVFFVLHDNVMKEFEVENIRLKMLDINIRASKFDLDINVFNSSDRIYFHFEYNTDLFCTETISQLFQNYLGVLKNIMSITNKPLKKLCISSIKQQEKLTSFSILKSNKKVDEYINEQAQKYPYKIAIQDNNSQITFLELHKKANQLVHWLRKNKILPRSNIAIIMNRSINCIIAMLATIKLGGCFVPIDINLPNERKLFILRDAEIKYILINDRELNITFNEAAKIKVLNLSEDWNEKISVLPTSNIEVKIKPEDLIYIMYTSGTTGVPKGVAIMHKNVVRLIESFILFFKENQTVLNYASISFDAAIFEIWCSLCLGSKVVILPEQLSNIDLINFINKNNISIMWLTAGLFNALVEEEDFLNHKLKYLLVGGDVVSPAHVDQGYLKFPNSAIVNGYGPTECTTFTTLHFIEKNIKNRIRIPIGSPIKDTEVYVLDDFFNPLPPGLPGMLYIGGSGVAQCYYNRPKLTAEKFIPNRFADNGERLYCTGDLVKLLPNGLIDFIGRIDNQVKIRGFRVELSDIESVIVQFPAVKEAAVIIKHFADNDKRIIAFVNFLDSSAKVEKLKEYLNDKLPGYMQPSYIINLQEFPLTDNGKIDKFKLQEIGVNTCSENTFIKPKSEVEKTIATIWREVLAVPQVSMLDNFFDLGGDSLLATQVISRVKSKLEIEVPLKYLFDAENLQTFISMFVNKAPQVKNGSNSLQKINRCVEKFPPSFAQQRMWFLNELDGNSTAYNIPVLLELTGLIFIEKIKQSFEMISMRHETLRTIFKKDENGNVYQYVLDNPLFGFEVIDAKFDSSINIEEQVEEVLQKKYLVNFDLQNGPMFIIRLISLSEEQHFMLLIMHHIISDGWSMGVLTKEFTHIYSKLVSNEEVTLPALPIQYIDFAVWQNQYMQSADIKQQELYWKNKLNNLSPILDFPKDFTRPNIQDYKGDTEIFAIPKSQLNEFKKTLGNNFTLFMGLLSVFNILLYRYTGKSDLAVGTPIANRNISDIEPLIGFFVNTVIIRNNIDQNMSFYNVLEHVKTNTLEAYANQDVPFEHIVEITQPERSLSYTPFTQIRFILQNASINNIKIKNLQISSKIINTKTSKFDLTVAFVENEQGLQGVIEYSSALFKKESIIRIINHYNKLLNNIIKTPNVPIKKLDFLTEYEEELFSQKLNLLGQYDTNNMFNVFFENNAKIFPSNIAIKYQDKKYTYKQLNSISNVFANILLNASISLGDRVVVCIGDPVKRIISILSLLKLGAIFIPLDPKFPIIRLKNLVNDITPKLLLIDNVHFSTLYEKNYILLNEQMMYDFSCKNSDGNLNRSIPPKNPAYIIYTSGSTGKPKGVCIPHIAIVNYAKGFTEKINLEQGDSIAAMGSSAADFWYTAMFGSFFVGATLYLVSDDDYLDPSRLASLFTKCPVDYLKVVPSHLKALIEDSSTCKLFPKKGLIFGGETSDVKLINKIKQLSCNSFLIFNHYGPTETTIGVATYSLNKQEQHYELTLPIGKPLNNCNLYVLDTNMKPVPINVIGKLYIGGLCVANGYFNNPVITAQKFIPNPLSKVENENNRIYDTGDLVKYLSDGNIVFVGRYDSQIKLRGFRIEIGEIENTILGYHQIKNAIVLRSKERDELNAFIVLKKSDKDRSKFEEQHVASWEEFYEQFDRQNNNEYSPNDNYYGWNSSYTGLPIPIKDMDIWFKTIVERILQLKPKNVLEIGCGYGLFLFNIADKVERYLGIDFSSISLEHVKSKLKGQELQKKVLLLKRRAHELTDIEACKYDTIIINSVVQYFPSINYLMKVLKQCCAFIKKPGKIFIGDVRNLLLYDAFLTSIAMHDKALNTTIADISFEMNRKKAIEKELIIDPNFFANLHKYLPEIQIIKILPRINTLDNELLTYRYDVVIHVGNQNDIYLIDNWIDYEEGLFTIEKIKNIILTSSPDYIAIKGIPNVKLNKILYVEHLTKISSMFNTTLHDVNENYAECFIDTPDIRDYINISKETSYEIEITWDGSDATGAFNIIFFNPKLNFGKILPKFKLQEQNNNLHHWANDPLKIEYQQEFIKKLKKYLYKHLLEPMVPNNFYFFDVLPLLPNGKTDKEYLQIFAKNTTNNKNLLFAPAVTVIEKYLVSLVEEILSLKKVSVTDNFFDLGGHSLLATKLITRIRAYYQIDFPIKKVFECPIIRELSKEIEISLIHNKTELLEIIPLIERSNIPLSYAQNRLWFLHKLEGKNSTYNRPIVLRMIGSLNINLLKITLQKIIDRHEVLRTSFPQIDGHIKQFIHNGFAINIPIINLLNSNDKERESKDIIQQCYSYLFNLEESPPIIIKLLMLNKDNNLLIITVHHIISDGWSIDIFINELSTIYTGLLNGGRINLPDLKIQYGDFAQWQQNWFERGNIQKQMEYWKQQLHNAPLITQLSMDKPRPEKPKFVGRTEKFFLDQETKKSLTVICEQEKVTLFMLLLTIFNVLVYKDSGQKDIVIGTPVANRLRPEVENLIGFFVNTLAIRTKIASNLTFKDYLAAVRSVLLEAYDNQDLPFEKLVEAINPQRNLSFTPIFQMMFIMQNARAAKFSLPGVEIIPEELDFSVSSFDMIFQVYEKSEELEFFVEYNTEIFSIERIKDFIIRFKILVNFILKNKNEKIINISIFSKNEAKQFLGFWGERFYKIQKTAFLQNISNNGIILPNECNTNYWSKILNGITNLHLPEDNYRSIVPSYQKGLVEFIIDESLFVSLDKFASQHNVSLYMVLLLALYILLYNFSKQPDIVIGTPVIRGFNSKKHSFINLLALRLNVAGQTGIELIDKIRQVCLEGYNNREVPFEELVENLRIENNQYYSPIFQTMFVLHDEFTYKQLITKKNEDIFVGKQFSSNINKLNLGLFMGKCSAILLGCLKYDVDKYSRDTITRIANYYVAILKELLSVPEKMAGDFLNLPKDEYQKIIVDWNNKKLPLLKNKNVVCLFEKEVIESANKIAVMDINKQLTYKQLNEKSNQIARFIKFKIKQLGNHGNIVIAMCLEKNVEMVAAILGILKAQAIYLPLDPTYPKERLSVMLKESDAGLILTQEKFISSFSNISVPTIILDGGNVNDILKQNSSNLDIKIKAEDKAYVLYTSGTSGVPKGVVTKHNSLANFSQAVVLEYGLKKEDIILQFASIGFGTANEEIFPCLLKGATLFLSTEEMRLSYFELLKKCEQYNISVLDLPTSYWHQMVIAISEHLISLPPSIRIVIIGGDKVDIDKVKLWYKNTRGLTIKLINTYGCTEGTVVSAKYLLPSSVANINNVPIGKPILNNNLYILNEYKHPVPICIPGEIYIGGAGVTAGYLNNPILTDEKYIADPFSADSKSKLYKTGDQGRWKPDGNIEYLGRIDCQVKIRNFRVELSEIESVLLHSGLINDVIVMVRNETLTGLNQLIAYITYDKDLTISFDELEENLRSHTKRYLPEYMVPSFFVFTESFPLNANGKIDRKLLYPPEDNKFIRRKYVAPRNTIEKELTEIWCNILKIENVGIYNDFFSIGGHSLLAVHLLNKINTRFNKNLFVSWVFQYPTIEKQAAYLTSNHLFERDPILIFNDSGKYPPLFFVHPGGGNAGVYYNLANQLDRSIPFYGIESHNMYSNDQHIDTLELLAKTYIYEIKKIKRTGPYILGGWSFGGLVAYEMARQLSALGEIIIGVYMIDTNVFSETEQTLLNKLNKVLEEFQKQKGYFEMPLQYREKIKLAYALDNKMSRDYSYLYYNGNVILFNATMSMQPPSNITDIERNLYKQYIDFTSKKTANGWVNIVPNIKELKFEVDHYGIMKEECLREITLFIESDIKNKIMV